MYGRGLPRKDSRLASLEICAAKRLLVPLSGWQVGGAELLRASHKSARNDHDVLAVVAP